MYLYVDMCVYVHIRVYVYICMLDSLMWHDSCVHTIHNFTYVYMYLYVDIYIYIYICPHLIRFDFLCGPAIFSSYATCHITWRILFTCHVKWCMSRDMHHVSSTLKHSDFLCVPAVVWSYEKYDSFIWSYVTWDIPHDKYAYVTWHVTWLIHVSFSYWISMQASNSPYGHTWYGTWLIWSYVIWDMTHMVIRDMGHDSYGHTW